MNEVLFLEHWCGVKRSYVHFNDLHVHECSCSNHEKHVRKSNVRYVPDLFSLNAFGSLKICSPFNLLIVPLLYTKNSRSTNLSRKWMTKNPFFFPIWNFSGPYHMVYKAVSWKYILSRGPWCSSFPMVPWKDQKEPLK